MSKNDVVPFGGYNSYSKPPKNAVPIYFEDPTQYTMLESMLAYMRPHRSEVEKEFVKDFIENIEGIKSDTYGNYYIRIGTAPILWSSHVDTVHYNSGYQYLYKDDKHIYAGNKSNCLGADCTTGVYIMLRLLDKGVEGLYIFHRDEEVGCKGSKWIVDNNPELLNDMKIAIALDRKGMGDVITHQKSNRTCSDEFAKSLSSYLNENCKYPNADKWAPCQGVYTDTAEYLYNIPECTNISVGYYDQHSSSEKQNFIFVEYLIDALVKMKYEDLTVTRDPVKAKEADTYKYASYKPKYDGYYGQHSSWNNIKNQSGKTTGKFTKYNANDTVITENTKLIKRSTYKLACILKSKNIKPTDFEKMLDNMYAKAMKKYREETTQSEDVDVYNHLM